MLGDKACHDIRPGASGLREDEFDRLVGPDLRMRIEKRQACGGAHKQDIGETFHGLVSSDWLNAATICSNAAQFDATP